MFMAAFLLLRVRSMPRSFFVPLYGTLILAMYLTHVTESEIFVILLAVYSLFSRSSKDSTLRLDDALLSSVIGFIIAGAFSTYTSFFWTSEVKSTDSDYRVVLSWVLPTLLLASSMLWRWKVLPRISFNLKLFSSQRFYSLLSISLVIIYFFGF